MEDVSPSPAPSPESLGAQDSAQAVFASTLKRLLAGPVNASRAFGAIETWTFAELMDSIDNSNDVEVLRACQKTLEARTAALAVVPPEALTEAAHRALHTGCVIHGTNTACTKV